MTDARPVGVVVDTMVIAAGAIRLGLPLVSHDGVFHAAPRLELLTVAAET